MTMIHKDGEISSTVSGHRATRHDDGWHVSYLPGRTFTDLQATTAMVIAELVAHGPVRTRWKPHVRNWMREICITEAELPQPLPGHASSEGGERQ